MSQPQPDRTHALTTREVALYVCTLLLALLGSHFWPWGYALLV